MNFIIPLKKVENKGIGLFEDMKTRESFVAHYEGNAIKVVVDFSMPKNLIPKSVNLQFKDIQKKIVIE